MCEWLVHRVGDFNRSMSFAPRVFSYISSHFLSACLPVWLSGCLPVCLSACVPCLSVCLSVCLSACLLEGAKRQAEPKNSNPYFPREGYETDLTDKITQIGPACCKPGVPYLPGADTLNLTTDTY